jgi:prevent-host-death family protein
MSNNGETAMETLAAHELAERINEILRRVEEDGETYEVTNYGEVIARLVPVIRSSHPSTEQQSEEAWTSLDRLTSEIGAHLLDKIDSVDIIRDLRRDL